MWCGPPQYKVCSSSLTRFLRYIVSKMKSVETFNSYVPSCQQHLIIMRYSCRHCQRINFVELSTSHHGHPGLNGPQKGINDPDKVSHAPKGGLANWSPQTTVWQPLGKNGQSAVRVIYAFLGSIQHLDGHGGLWKVIQSRFFGSGDKNIA